LARPNDSAIGLEQEGAAMAKHEAGGVPAPCGFRKGHQIDFDDRGDQGWIVRFHFGNRDLKGPAIVLGKRYFQSIPLCAYPIA
jgi:hypothetical protein